MAVNIGPDWGVTRHKTRHATRHVGVMWGGEMSNVKRENVKREGQWENS
jgi:hypothetical protein